jgi:hypothetical protein
MVDKPGEHRCTDAAVYALVFFIMSATTRMTAATPMRMKLYVPMIRSLLRHMTRKTEDSSYARVSQSLLTYRVLRI